MKKIFKVGFKRSYLFFITLSFLAIAIIGGYYYFYNNLRPEEFSFSIIHNSNLNGKLDPCGCMFHPLGGLASKGTLFKEVLKDKKNYLIFDSGDSLFSYHDVDLELEENKKDIKILKNNAEIIIDTMNHWKFFAATIGDHDLGGGYENWVSIQKKANYPIVSINAKDRDNIIKPYVMKYFRGIKVLITGVTGTYNVEPYFFKADGKIKISMDYKEPLEKLISEQNSDFVIVLSHGGFHFDEALAREVKGIDLILGGHEMDYSGESKIDDTIIIHNGKDGKIFSKIDVSLKLNKENNKYSKEISSELIEVDPNVEPDENVLKILKKRK